MSHYYAVLDVVSFMSWLTMVVGTEDNLFLFGLDLAVEINGAGDTSTDVNNKTQTKQIVGHCLAAVLVITADNPQLQAK